MKRVLAAFAACCLLATPALAWRYTQRQNTALAPGCNIIMPCEMAAKPEKPHRTNRPRSVAAARAVRKHPVLTAKHRGVHLIRIARKPSASSAEVIGGRPSGCPHAFCGCGASLYLFGKIKEDLNLAANWLRFPHVPHDQAQPRMAAARKHHVMVLVTHLGGENWLVYDANSGGGKTRLHARNISGYTVVRPS